MAESGGKNLSVTSSVVGDESDPPLSGGLRRRHQFPNGVEDNLELSVVLPFQRPELAGQVGVRSKHSAQPHERAHDVEPLA